MSEFWKVSLFWAGLAAMVGVALAFVLAPLLRGGASKRAVLGLAMLVPAVAIGMYAWLGNPGALLAPRASVQEAGATQGQHDVLSMIGALEEKLKASPDDVSGWLMLARSYEAMERYPEAGQAFERVTQLAPGDARGWSGMAEVIAVLQGHRLEGRPRDLVRKALELNAKDEKGLELAGIAEFQAGNFAQAAFYWRQLIKMLPPDSDYTRELEAAANEAMTMARDKSGPKAATPSAPVAAREPPLDNLNAPAPAGKGTLSGEVRLAPALAARVKPDATVFIFARPAEGRGMPLAALRVRAGELPYRFTLTDAMAMAPEAKLSGHAQVVVGARISTSGNAMPSSGDLSGTSGPVATGSTGITVLIDRVVP